MIIGTVLAAAGMSGLAGCAQPEWAAAEAPVLSAHVQLTSRDRFTKAGESYFSPDGRWIIFQAVDVPADGAEPAPFYSMFVARLTRDASGEITGAEAPILVSPPGSANTCGWFHPLEPGRILFGSTITPPKTEQKSGFQVGDRKYMWLFPEETEVVTREVREVYLDDFAQRVTASGGAAAAQRPKTAFDETPTPIFSRPDYDAECSWSGDGLFVLYAHVREDRTDGRADADIWLYDTGTRRSTPLVAADGYDGGPFFSPDGRFICYRSDRRLNDLLQVYVAELRLDHAGTPVGIEKEYALTANEHVNWGPYWHPSGRFLVYGTSEVGHHNYEVFAVEFDEAALKAGKPAGDLRRQRITHAAGADVMPVFNADGSLMMWTAQRGPMAESETRPSSQVWVARFDAAGVFPPAAKTDGQ